MPGLLHVSVLVKDYDEALDFYINKLGFTLVEDRPEPGKRWITVRPPGAGPEATTIVLARASTPEQEALIGKQSGGRVWLFLETDDFKATYERYSGHGIEWTREPKVESYGTVAVFKDLYGNQWDLIERPKQ